VIVLVICFSICEYRNLPTCHYAIA